MDGDIVEVIIERQRQQRLETRMAPKRIDPGTYCEAKTWSQARSGTWAGSHSSNGCQFQAKYLTHDGHRACQRHAYNPPANGWN